MPTIKQVKKVALTTKPGESDGIKKLREAMSTHPLLRPEDYKIWKKTGLQINRIEAGVRNRKLKLKTVYLFEIPKHAEAAIEALGKANSVAYYGGHAPTGIKSGYVRIYLEEEALKALAKKHCLERIYPQRAFSPVSSPRRTRTIASKV
ncbi:MAG: hypothetical protein V1817_03920 [Candidatus Micrarchaeota archaeon]